jgi:predicted transcriptional regulator
MKQKRSKKTIPVIGIRDTKNFLPRLRQIAQSEDRSISFVIRRALAREINETLLGRAPESER